MKRRRAHREAGFALIESIAVLALSGLVLTTLLLATDLISRNSAAAARRANTIETLTTGLAAIRRDLEGARFIRIGTRQEDPILFSGTAQAVAVAVGDDGTGLADGESLILIETRYGEGTGTLVRSSSRLLPGTTGFGGSSFGSSAVVISGPWRYRFSYADFTSGGERWRGTWAASGRLPEAIRLEVLDDGGERVVPPLVVRVAVNSGGCAEAARAECTAQEEEPAVEDTGTGQQDEGGDSGGPGDQNGG